MASWTGRTIVYDPGFEKEIDRLRVDYARLDEAISGVEWALSNNPKVFPALDGSKLRKATVESAPGVPQLRIWFTVNAQKINVLHAEEYEEEDT